VGEKKMYSHIIPLVAWTSVFRWVAFMQYLFTDCWTSKLDHDITTFMLIFVSRRYTQRGCEHETAARLRNTDCAQQQQLAERLSPQIWESLYHPIHQREEWPAESGGDDSKNDDACGLSLYYTLRLHLPPFIFLAVSTENLTAEVISLDFNSWWFSI
jgi:hypothetical protein